MATRKLLLAKIRIEETTDKTADMEVVILPEGTELPEGMSPKRMMMFDGDLKMGDADYPDESRRPKGLLFVNGRPCELRTAIDITKRKPQEIIKRKEPAVKRWFLRVAAPKGMKKIIADFMHAIIEDEGLPVYKVKVADFLKRSGHRTVEDYMQHTRKVRQKMIELINTKDAPEDIKQEILAGMLTDEEIEKAGEQMKKSEYMYLKSGGVKEIKL